MARSPLEKFITGLKQLDYTRARMEELYGERRIALRDVHSVYESLFLRAVTSFEVFLEELFISILTEKIQYPRSRVRLKMTAVTKSALVDILLQGQNYMTWLPFDNTSNRAMLYLKDGRPFSDLSNGDRSLVKSITLIRNAIAHKSVHATDQFEAKVIGSQNLLRGEKQPAGYLRSQIRSSPTRNRFELYVAELGRIASDLC